MIHRVLLLSVCVALLVPATALALSLDELSLHSGLGEPLKADIRLLNADTAVLGDLRIRLASHQAYRQAGITARPDLGQLHFVVDRNTGQPLIRVSGNKPVYEPAIVLLLEVSWSDGRLLREYTLHIDPAGR